MHTIEEQIAEAQRELGMRETVYKKRVAEMKMRQSDANRLMNLQRCIIKSLQSLAEKKGTQASIFGDDRFSIENNVKP